MRKQVLRKFIITFVFELFLFLMLFRIGLAQNYERQFFLQDEQDTYQLTLSITSSLYEYYQQKNHLLTQNNFATFVTPYSMALVAADVRSVFPSEEGYVNAALMLVHQIPYQIIEEPKYPVETIIKNQGDCDLLSYVCASLLKAQDLDVVLFYYETESHMNVGVHLPNPPRDARTPSSYVDYAGTRYYMAECTGNDWQNGWRVGECPSELEGAIVTVVPLEGYEQVSPGQVSSSYGTMESSLISLAFSQDLVIEGSTIIISGVVSASTLNGTVTLYASTSENWLAIETVSLDSTGQYTFSWNPMSWGLYYVKASWSGNEEHAGADSAIASIFVVPKFLLLVGGGLVIVVIVSIILLLMYRTTRPQEIQTPTEYQYQ